MASLIALEALLDWHEDLGVHTDAPGDQAAEDGLKEIA